MPHCHLIGAGGIGVSALGRYYQSLGWSVSWSDSSATDITDELEKNGMTIFIGHAEENIQKDTDLVIYSEAIITKPDLPVAEQLDANPELRFARSLWIKCQSYPEALAHISNEKFQIAVSGSHGKSTTTSLIGTVLKRSIPGGSTVVGTKLAEFGGTNLWSVPKSPFFAIEACEYRRSFLHYTPSIAIITNIDIDHLDYYQNRDDYLSAFISLVWNTKKAVILAWDDTECQRLYTHVLKKWGNTLDWYFVHSDGYTINTLSKDSLHSFPSFILQVPGDHILFDAKLAYTALMVAGIQEQEIVSGLEAYSGAWRRSEFIGNTPHKNLLLSDYWHHPSEIRPTLKALKWAYAQKKFIVIFQPHQYSRTRELLTEFSTCFSHADHLIIPDIYFSRDKKEDVEWMTTDRLVKAISVYHQSVENGYWLENTLAMIQRLDRDHPGELVFLLLWAGSIDSLRYKIISK